MIFADVFFIHAEFVAVFKLGRRGNDDVSAQNDRIPAGNDGVLSPYDEHGEKFLGHDHLAELFAEPGVIFAHAHFYEAYVAFLLIVGKCAQNVVVIPEHVQLFRHEGQQRPLQGDGYDDDDEYDAEQIVRERVAGFRNAQRRHGVDGKHDGRDPAQPCPAHNADLIELCAEGKQERRDRRGAGDDRHEYEDQKGGREHGGLDEIFRRRQKAEQEKDHHLRHVRERVEKAHAVSLLRNAGVPDHDAAQVHREIAVARKRRNAGKLAEHGRERVRHEPYGKDKDGAALPHVEGKLFEYEDRQKAERRAEDRAETDLRKEHADDLPRPHRRRARNTVLCGEHGGKYHGEHIRGGVVGARFHFQQ